MIRQVIEDWLVEKGCFWDDVYNLYRGNNYHKEHFYDSRRVRFEPDGLLMWRTDNYVPIHIRFGDPNLFKKLRSFFDD